MESLPNEVLINLFLKLPLPSINKLCSTHPHLRNFCQSDYLWQLKTEERYGTFNKPDHLTWQAVYRGLLSGKYYLIDLWYKLDRNGNENKLKMFVSIDELDGLMFLLYLYFEYLSEMGEIECEEEIFELNLIQDINDPEQYTGPTTSEYNGDRFYDHGISDSYNGISDILPEQDENEDFLDYINRISGENVLSRLKTYVAILTTPALKPWMLVSFDNLDFIKGVKLGCQLYSLDCRQYLVKLAK